MCEQVAKLRRGRPSRRVVAQAIINTSINSELTPGNRSIGL